MNHRRIHRQLGFEQLESRALLAGNVRAFVLGGNLIVNGDRQANEIVIVQGALGPQSFAISGQNGTKINGVVGDVDLPGVTRDVRINLHGGDDMLTVGGMDHTTVLNRNLVVATGRDRDTAFVYNVDVAGKTAIKAGSGENTVLLGTDYGSRGTFFRKGLTVRTGDDNDTVEAYDVTVERKLQIEMERGSDLADLYNIVVNGDTFVDAGPCRAGDVVEIAGGSRVASELNGNVTIITHTGPDRVEFYDVQVLGDTDIRTGDGDDEVDLSSGRLVTAFAGDVMVRTESGNDLVNLYDTDVLGDLWIRTSRDNDRVMLGGGPLGGGHFAGNVDIGTGQEDDRVEINKSQIDGETSLKGGRGSDRFDIDDSVLDALFAHLGSDDDALNIEQRPAPHGPAALERAPATVNGPAKIYMGVGNDVLRIGVEGDPDRSVTFNDMVFADGGAGFDEFGFAVDNQVRVPYTEWRFETFWPTPVRSAGHIYLMDGVEGVIEVDPTTGDRMVISGGFDVVGNGPEFEFPVGITVDDAGQIYVADEGVDAVFHIDPATGDRTIVSSASVGTGPDFDDPYGIVVDATGSILVTDTALDAVFRVDPATGNRTIISGDPLGANVGTGTSFLRPHDIDVEAGGTIVVVDAARAAVFRIDPVTGNRTTVTSETVGSGTKPFSPSGLEVTAGGEILITDSVKKSVFRVNPVNGDRTTIATNFGSGLTGIAVEASGDILVVDIDIALSGSLYRVDPATGTRTVVASDLVGSGVEFTFSSYVAVG